MIEINKIKLNKILKPVNRLVEKRIDLSQPIKDSIELSTKKIVEDKQPPIKKIHQYLISKFPGKKAVINQTENATALGSERSVSQNLFKLNLDRKRPRIIDVLANILDDKAKVEFMEKINTNPKLVEDFPWDKLDGFEDELRDINKDELNDFLNMIVSKTEEKGFSWKNITDSLKITKQFDIDDLINFADDWQSLSGNKKGIELLNNLPDEVQKKLSKTDVIKILSNKEINFDGSSKLLSSLNSETLEKLGNSNLLEILSNKEINHNEASVFAKNLNSKVLEKLDTYDLVAILTNKNADVKKVSEFISNINPNILEELKSYHLSKIFINNEPDYHKIVKVINNLDPEILKNIGSDHLKDILTKKDFDFERVSKLIEVVNTNKEKVNAYELGVALSKNSEDIEAATLKFSTKIGDKLSAEKLAKLFKIDDTAFDLTPIISNKVAYESVRYHFSDSYYLTQARENILKSLSELPHGVSQSRIDTLLKIANDPNINDLTKTSIINLVSKSYSTYKLSDEAITLLAKDFNSFYDNIMSNAEKYVNGEYHSSQLAPEVNRVFIENSDKIAKLLSVTNKDTALFLASKRFEKFEESLKTLNNLSESNLNLLIKGVKSNDITGKPLLPTQKAELIDILNAYQLSKMPTDEIAHMINSNKLNLSEVKKKLIGSILQNAGISQKELALIPKEAIDGWNFDYIHLMPEALLDSKMGNNLKELIKQSTLGDFKKYISDVSNVYGLDNAVTQQKFSEAGLNYEKWFNPNKIETVIVKSTSRTQDQIALTAEQFLNDVKALYDTPVKGIISKQYVKNGLLKYTKEGNFELDPEVLGSKTKLQEFISNFNKSLEPVWLRAQGNLKDETKAIQAGNTLTYKSHFEQNIKDLEAISAEGKTKALDLTVKMWDRIPQKDLFQGSYSNCCIALNGGNGHAMPNYLLNSAFNMVEITDNITKKPIGNALIYWAKDIAGKPVLIADNVEMANGYKNNQDVREGIISYLEKMTKEVNQGQKTEIYLGPNYNDIPTDGLKYLDSKQIQFIGKVTEPKQYLDAFGGWSNNITEPHSAKAYIFK